MELRFKPGDRVKCVGGPMYVGDWCIITEIITKEDPYDYDYNATIYGTEGTDDGFYDNELEPDQSWLNEQTMKKLLGVSDEV